MYSRKRMLAKSNFMIWWWLIWEEKVLHINWVLINSVIEDIILLMTLRSWLLNISSFYWMHMMLYNHFFHLLSNCMHSIPLCMGYNFVIWSTKRSYNIYTPWCSTKNGADCCKSASKFHRKLELKCSVHRGKGLGTTPDPSHGTHPTYWILETSRSSLGHC